MQFNEREREATRAIIEEMQRQIAKIDAIRNQKERRQRDEPVEKERRSGKDRRR